MLNSQTVFHVEILRCPKGLQPKGQVTFGILDVVRNDGFTTTPNPEQQVVRGPLRAHGPGRNSETDIKTRPKK